jgi:hypothetical protein
MAPLILGGLKQKSQAFRSPSQSLATHRASDHLLPPEKKQAETKPFANARVAFGAAQETL